MGKKNRNKGGKRDRYSDIYGDMDDYDYDGYDSQDDENYRYSYQDEIDSSEFAPTDDKREIKVEEEYEEDEYVERNFRSPNNAQSKQDYEEKPNTVEKKKSLAAEEREAWNFAQKPTRNSQSDNKQEVKNETKIAKTDAEPKGPNVVVRTKVLVSDWVAKISQMMKRKTKSEAEEKNSKIGEVWANVKPKLNTVWVKALSFLKKKPLKGVGNDTKKADGETVKKEEKSTVIPGIPEKTAEEMARDNRKTYLIVGSITVTIVALLMIAGVIFLVSYSGSKAANNENTETIEAVESAETTKIAETVKAPETEISETLTVPAEGVVPAIPNTKPVPPEAPAVVELEAEAINLDGLELDSGLEANFAETLPETPVETTPEKPEDIGGSADTLGDLLGEALSNDLSEEGEKGLENIGIENSIELPTDLEKEIAAGSAPAPISSLEDANTAHLDLPELGKSESGPTLALTDSDQSLPEELEVEADVKAGSNVPEWNNANGGLLDVPFTPQGMNATPETDTVQGNNTADDPLAGLNSLEPEDKSLATLETLSLNENSANTSDLGNLENLSVPQTSSDTHLDGILANEEESGKKENNASNDDSPKYTSHIVAREDTYWRISEKYYGTPAYKEALARYNSDVAPDANNLKVGTLLQIPELEFLRSCFPTLCPQGVRATPAQISEGGEVVYVQYYCVAEGDTLSAVAERLLGDSSRWPEIYRLNIEKIPNLDMLPVGEKLQIPVEPPVPESRIWQ